MLDRVIQAPQRLESGKIRTSFLTTNRMALVLVPQKEQLSSAGAAQSRWGSSRYPEGDYEDDDENKQDSDDDEERTDDTDCHDRHVGTHRHGTDDDDRVCGIAHPQHAEIRVKSILKVKSQEDSLKSCGTNEHSRRRRRQSSGYGRMMAKLQKIRSKSNRSLVLDLERQERNEALCATCHSRESSTLSEQEAFYQQQQQQQHDEARAEQNLDQDNAVVDEVLSTLSRERQLLLRRVSFSTISIRNYKLTLYDNLRFPSSKATIGLSWIFEELPTRNVDEYEQEKVNKASTSPATHTAIAAESSTTTTTTTTTAAASVEQPTSDDARLSLPERQRLLEELGLPQHEVKSYLDSMEASRKQRSRAKAAQQRRSRVPISLSSRRRRRRMQNKQSTPPAVLCGKCQQAGQASRDVGNNAGASPSNLPSSLPQHNPLGLLKPWNRAQRQGWEEHGRFQTWLPNWLSVAVSRT